VPQHARAKVTGHGRGVIVGSIIDDDDLPRLVGSLSDDTRDRSRE
jgi:hypothetical protein